MKRLRKDNKMKIKTLFLSIVVCFMGSARTYADGTFPAITSVPFDKTSLTTGQYRIPSLVRINANTLIAFTDLRAKGGDVGATDGHNSIVAKKSIDNGQTWGDQVTILDATKQSDSNFKYGDPATVYDPVSGKILLMCCGGTVKYGSSTKDNPIRTYKSLVDPVTLKLVDPNDLNKQVDGPTDVTDQIYGLFSSTTLKGLFPTSGEMCRSKYIKDKTTDQHRIYLALATNIGAKVIYTDDLGTTWHVLGDPSTQTMYKANNYTSDETKCAELPDTSVWISSRYNGEGRSRGFNVFSYDRKDATFASGTWGDPNSPNCEATPSSSNGNFRMSASRCNASLVIVPARRVSDGTNVYIAFHSIPYGEWGTNPTLKVKTYTDRKDLGINWKVLKDRNDFTTMDGSDVQVTNSKGTFPVNGSHKLLTGWNNYQVNADYSAYSTMLDNGTDGVDLLFEHTTTTGPYGIAYQNLSISTITSGAYTYASDLDNAAYMNVNVKPVPGNVYLIKARYNDGKGNITEGYLHSNFTPITENGVTHDDNASLTARVLSKNFLATSHPDPTYYWVFSQDPTENGKDKSPYFSSFNADGYMGWGEGGQDYRTGAKASTAICSPYWYCAFDIDGLQHKATLIDGATGVTASDVDGYSLQFYHTSYNTDRFLAVKKDGTEVNWTINTGNRVGNNEAWSTDLIFVKVQPSGKGLNNPKAFGSFNAPTYNGDGYPITFTRSDDDCDAYKEAQKKGTADSFDFNYYASLRAPFAVYVPDGVTVYKLNSVDPKNYTLDMKEYTNELPTDANGKKIIPRETPVIMRCDGKRGNDQTSVIKNFTIAPSQPFNTAYRGVDETSNPTTNLNGTLGRRVFDDTVYKSVEGGTGSSVYYLLGKVNGYVALYRLGRNSNKKFAIAHNKAYFVFNTQNGTSQAKPFFAMSFSDGETTAIQSVVTKGIADGKVYDLNGRYMGTSLNGLAKGIYILNGRKVVK